MRTAPDQEKLNQMFELDTLAISESDSVHETFPKDMTYESNHYAVSLPWREYNDTLPDNYELCVGRLKSTLRHLRRNPSLLDQYHNVIQDQIETGIAEEVKPHSKESIPSKEPCRTHYLSHHGVVCKEALTTKLKVKLIRYVPCCSHYDDFRYRHKGLVDRLLLQG